MTECVICEKPIEIKEAEMFIDKTEGVKVYVCDYCIKENEQHDKYYEDLLNMRLKQKRK